MSSPGPLILIVEDERSIRRFLRTSLLGAGFRISECETGQLALLAATTQPPDLIVLDLGLPDMDGLNIIDEVRGWSKVPIIVLSARGQEKDKVAALDRGADDYLSKPFGVEELLARIRVALRRANRVDQPDAGETALHAVGELSIDMARRLVTVGGREVHLTPLEYRLLTTLARSAGKVLTHRQLLTEVWGPGHADEPHYVRVFMANLRQKIEENPARPRYLLTEQGVGYRLAER